MCKYIEIYIYSNPRGQLLVLNCLVAADQPMRALVVGRRQSIDVGEWKILGHLHLAFLI